MIIIWLLFVLILGFSHLLPHRDLDFISLLNSSLAFLCFILCVNIFLKNGSPRLFFIPFGLFFFFYSTFIITLFIGAEGVTGSNFDAWVVYILLLMIADLLLSVSITFLALKYTLNNTSSGILLLFALLMSSIALIFNYHKIIFSFDQIISAGNPIPLWWASIKMHFFWFAMLFLYWYNSIKKDALLGQYVNSIVFGISLYIPMDLLHLYFMLFKIETINGINPYWNLIIICFLGLLLTLKLYSVSTLYGKWYEQISIFGDTHFGRRRGIFDRFIYRLFFSEEKNRNKL